MERSLIDDDSSAGHLLWRLRRRERAGVLRRTSEGRRILREEAEMSRKAHAAYLECMRNDPVKRRQGRAFVTAWDLACPWLDDVSVERGWMVEVTESSAYVAVTYHLA